MVGTKDILVVAGDVADTNLPCRRRDSGPDTPPYRIAEHLEDPSEVGRLFEG
jgi:hypothetical protein